MYKVLLRKKVHRELKKIDKRYKIKILKKLARLKKKPYLGKKLVGDLKGYYSLRAWPYRIIYKVYKKKLIVFVIDIGHRQGVYK